jgi:hypothetical protein
MRRTTPPLLALSAACLVTACTAEGRRGAGAERCADFLRMGADDLVVMSLDDGGAVTPVPARCEQSSCLRARADFVAVLQPDGSVWARFGEEPGAVLSAGASPPPLSAPPSAEAGLDDDAASPVAKLLAEASPPVLPEGYRTCGTTSAGGGFGWHVIRNAGDVWQRVHWTLAPQQQAVRALAPDAYPLARADGTLCAWARQRSTRDWEVHLPSGLVVPAARDHEHPPARCVGEGAVELLGRDGSRRFEADGSEAPSQAVWGPPWPEARDASVMHDGAGLFPAPGRAFEVVQANGEKWTRALAEDRDLAGAALPAGTARERLLARGDGAGRLLVAERFRLPGCQTIERLHLVRLPGQPGGDPDERAAAAKPEEKHRDKQGAEQGAEQGGERQGHGEIKTLREGDLVFSRLSVGLGRFYWLESTPRLVDVSGR